MKPYEIVGELKRFDRRSTASARSRSDRTSAAHGKKSRTREEVVAAGEAGYGLEDFALLAGARAPDGLIRRHWRELAEPAKAQVPAERYEPQDWGHFTQRVKEAARFYGAALAGVTRVNPLWLYACNGEEELPGGLDTAVVMAIEMDYDLIAASPAVTAAAAVGLGYSKMAFAALCLARYLTELGWRAVPSGNDIALSIPLAIDAGLGECGRNGSLITEACGPRVRLCKVFTDAPLAADEPVAFGVRQACEGCTKCAEACPAGAIASGGRTATGPTPSNNPGALKWYVNADKCRAFWAVNGTSCCNCIARCPFNKR